MVHLPEPRRYGGGSVTDELAGLARDAARADPLERPKAISALHRALAAVIAGGDDAPLHAAFRHVEDAASYRVLADALARSVEAATADAGVVARTFALPVVFVAAATQPLTLSGYLREPAALHELFERTHALGPTRNFGLSGALAAIEALEALSPSAVAAFARAPSPDKLEQLLPAAPIAVASRHEQTHLRFIVGAGLTAPESPGFAEVAANIGPWGQECARIVQEQLAAPGLQLLALPRPPLDLLRAAHAGRTAQLEVALSLFASNAVRRFRLAVGDPVAILSAHDDGDVRVTLSSPFADDMVEGFRWPLHPADDLAAVQASICELLAEMRVHDVRIVGHVLPARRTNTALFHPRCDEWDRVAAGVH